MGSIYSLYIRNVVEKVGSTLLQYEMDSSFANIPENDLLFIPKSYLKYKVRTIDLEFIWRKLPVVLQEDDDLLKYRPCFKHYVLDGDYIARKDCKLCAYDNL